MIYVPDVAPEVSSTAGSSILAGALPFAGQAATGVQEFRKGAAHNTATSFVNEFEQPLNSALAQAEQLRYTDPEQAKRILSSAYDKYLQGIQYYKNGLDNMSKVADQSLNNSALQNTIRSIAQNIGLDLQPIQAANPTTDLPYGTSSMYPGGNGVFTPFSYKPSSALTQSSQSIAEYPPESPDSSILSKILIAAPGILGGVLGAGPQGGVGSTGVPSAQPTNPNPNPSSGSPSLMKQLLPYLLLGGTVGSDIYSANKAASASTEATKLQTDAATHAADLQAATSDKTLALYKSIFDQTQANQQPWLEKGKLALDENSRLLGLSGDPSSTGYGSLAKPYDQTFSFTADDLLKDPGYQRRLADSQQALERSASAKGKIFTPGTTAATAAKVGAQASDEFSTAYNRALNTYMDKYNIFNTDQNNLFNRNNSIAGLGQTANNQLQSSGSTYGNQVGTTSQNSVTGINDALVGGANAAAQGGLNTAKATIGGVTNSTDDIVTLLTQLMKAGKI